MYVERGTTRENTNRSAMSESLFIPLPSALCPAPQRARRDGDTFLRRASALSFCPLPSSLCPSLSPVTELLIVIAIIVWCWRWRCRR